MLYKYVYNKYYIDINKTCFLCLDTVIKVRKKVSVLSLLSF